MVFEPMVSNSVPSYETEQTHILGIKQNINFKLTSHTFLDVDIYPGSLYSHQLIHI